MDNNSQQPVSVQPLEAGETFSFSCHKGVSCFTECCRMLELALTPYDALRLRRATGKSSAELLDQFIIMEQDQGEPFPRFYLTMVDDGRASCVFVSPEGCTIYSDRPGACRTYPMGRGVQRQNDGTVHEQFVIIKENHCQGFSEPVRQTPLEYTEDQKLESYNRFNDAVAAILQHETIKNGFIPTKKQVELFTLALYDIDTFRSLIEKGEFPGMEEEMSQEILKDDEKFLGFSIKWIQKQLFQGVGKLF